jgi:hypothetical protein
VIADQAKYWQRVANLDSRCDHPELTSKATDFREIEPDLVTARNNLMPFFCVCEILNFMETRFSDAARENDDSRIEGGPCRIY